jgi:ATP-dependent Clp protease adapter protein ClpS
MPDPGKQEDVSGVEDGGGVAAPVKREDAMTRMLEAHKSGVALLLVTHKERAELYKDQFQTKGLTCTIEPEK